MTCSKCDATLNIGDYPFCPHGRSASAVHTNERFIGGVTIENLGHEPVTVYSREEFKQQMDAHNVEQRIKYVPGDKHLTNWSAAIDAYTLEAATALLSRNAGRSERGDGIDPATVLKTYQSSVRLVKGGDDGVVVRR